MLTFPPGFPNLFTQSAIEKMFGNEDAILTSYMYF